MAHENDMAHTAHTASRRFALNFPALFDLRTRLLVWRTRRALATLDARALKDIGVTVLEAQTEAGLGPWDVPATWKRSV